MSTIGFWTHAAEAPDRPAIIDHEGTSLSYGELLRRSNRLAHGLQHRGLRPGDTVAVTLGNEAAFLEVAKAAAQIGLFLTPINVRLTGPELAHIVHDCAARVWIVGEPAAATAAQAATSLGSSAPLLFAAGKASDVAPLEDLAVGQSDTPPAERTAGQVMLYTSGTTGQPKGVRRPLPGVEPEAAARLTAGLAMLFGLTPGTGVHLVAAPLYHSAPLAFATAALHLGHTLVLLDKWDGLRALELIEQWRVTSSLMVPTMFHRLLGLPANDRNRFDLSSLQHVIHAGAPCPIDVKRRMLDWWGPVIYEFYAATEGGGTLVRPEEWLERPGTVGRPWPGAEIEIRDDDGRPCPPDRPGTVWIRSSIGDFEYHQDPAKTEAGRRNGFFTVGDIGYLDEDGWLFLNDRRDDIIVSGGVNIYPAEVEAALLSHPAVADVAVFGVPDDEWGEAVMAVVETASGIEPGSGLAAELLEWCRPRLAAYKRPRSIAFHPELPRQATGKLARRVLRDPHWTGRQRQV
jgi:long-chain acyl-CoA synthetase